MVRLLAPCLSITLFASALGSADTAGYVSPRWLSGALPTTPVLAVSGGEVWLEALVKSDGRVASVDVLRSTPPFTDVMVAAVRGWQFAPATLDSKAVDAHVLVAGMFTPPALIGPTLGAPPQTVRAPGADVPTPRLTRTALYPPQATGTGTVLVDMPVNPGAVPAVPRIVVSAPGFDDAALTACRSWSFAPAERGGHGVTTHAYVLFAFRPPVT
jgi:outer membrane biosynthesis protein TonB